VAHEEANPNLENLIAQREVDAWAICLPSGQSAPDRAFLRLDWRFRGAIERALRSNGLSRASGDVSLLPCTRPVSDLGSETFKILTLGVKDQANVSSEEIQKLVKNVKSLGLKRFGISASNFGLSEQEAKKRFTGTGVWIVA
jgi:hypothetical protein